MFQEFPKWKYSATGSVIVEDADAESALGDGWFNFPDEAISYSAGKTKAAELDADEEAKDLESLRATATSIGITVDGRWKAPRLEEEIKKVIHAEGEDPTAKDEA